MSDDKQQQLLEKVPRDGRTISNPQLMRDIGWPQAEYWEVRNRLIDSGAIEIGRGRGGTVRRTATPGSVPAGGGGRPGPTTGTPSSPGAAADGDAEERRRETHLYAPFARVLEEQWVKDKRFEYFLAQITAQQGRRATGGRWTRPDVTLASLSTYSYVPGRHFDVITFEIKPSDAIDVTAVYEALAHLRCATRAYVVLHVPADQAAALEDLVLEVVAEAKRHGIGVLTFEAAGDYATWDERVEPRRSEPDPHRMNDFLAKQLSKEQLERLVRWFR